IVSPVSGAKYNTGFYIAAIVADDASGVYKVEYQIDGGAWRLLPIADSSTGRYSTVWAPVIADEGVHTISFRAIDKSKNMSEPVSVGIIIEVLFGAITARPELVYQGRDEEISYSITNNANEDIANLKVKVAIIDADNKEIKQTFEIMPNVPMNTTITGSLIFSTATLAPKRYLAVLEAATAEMAEYKTLASTTFEVKPAIEAA
ncbi:MAG: Ig-like domain-containing protein, partial [Nitrospirota bacterium]